MKKFLEKHQIEFPLFRDLWLGFRMLICSISGFIKDNTRWEFRRLFVRAKKNFGESFSELFDDLGSALKELFVQIPRDIKHFVRNCWAFKGFLWEDRDWDYSFILRVMQLKIKKTRICIEKYGHHVGSEKDCKNMKQAEDMIESILEDDFGRDLYKAHDEKWGPSKHYSVPVPGSSSSYMRTARPNAYTPEQVEQERKEFVTMIRKIHKMEQREWQKLWKFLDKNLRSWWD